MHTNKDKNGEISSDCFSLELQQSPLDTFCKLFTSIDVLNLDTLRNTSKIYIDCIDFMYY